MQNRVMNILAAATALALAACSNGAPPKETLRVDLKALQMQLGITARAAGVETPSESPATNTVKTIVVGPLTHNNYGKPYSLENDAWTDEVKDIFTDDISNTGNLLLFIPMPTDKAYAEFEVPTVSNGWQVLAAASNVELKTPADLSKDENKDSLVYYGITEKTFNDAADLNSWGEPLKLQRACLIKKPNTPKGCATYNKYKDAIVTASVEIIGVRVNDKGKSTKEAIDGADSAVDGAMAGLSWTFPIVVRDAPVTGQTTTTTAESHLEELKKTIEANLNSIPTGTITRLTVYTTHTENPTESDACKALKDQAGVSVTTLKGACEVQRYFYSY